MTGRVQQKGGRTQDQEPPAAPTPLPPGVEAELAGIQVFF